MKKRRIVPIVLAVLLLLGMGAIAAQADSLRIDHAAEPVLQAGSYVGQYLQTGGSVTVYLHPGIFLDDAQTAAAPDVSRLQVVAVHHSGEAFRFLFGEPQFRAEPDGVVMALPVRSGAYTADIPFDYSLSFVYSGPSGMRQSGAFRFSGAVAANTRPADHSEPAAGSHTPVTADHGVEGYSITGWSAAQAVNRQSYSLSPGGTAQYGTLQTAEVFQYTGSAPLSLNDELVSAYGLAARTGSTYVTAALHRVSAADYRIDLQVSSGAPAGTYYADVELYSANGMLGGSLCYARLEVSVTGSSSGFYSTGSSSSVVGGRITGLNPDSVWGPAEKNGRALPHGDEALDNLWIRPGDDIVLYFDSDFFEWQDGAPEPPTTAVTLSQLRRANVSVKALGGQYTHLLETVELRYRNGRAYVYIRFVEPFVSTADIDFEIDIVLTKNGRYIKGTEAFLCGTIYNDFNEVFEGASYIDLSDGQVVEAVDTIADIEVLLGEGVSIFTRMVKGRSYYGVATFNELDAEDERVFADNPDVLAVYHLATVGLSDSGKNVAIDSAQQYHVYNRYLEYLGTTRDRLPYSTKYYLAARQLTTVAETAAAKGSTEPATAVFYEAPVPTGATPGPTGATNTAIPIPGGSASPTALSARYFGSPAADAAGFFCGNRALSNRRRTCAGRRFSI